MKRQDMNRNRTLLYIVILFVCALIGIDLNAQTTKVKGRVTEFGTGEPLPFVAVYFEGTTIGVTTDLDGYYSMETRDSSACMLTASLLG